MRVMTLGAIDQIGCAPCAGRRTMGSLPSSDAVQTVLDRQRGGWGKVVTSTLLRALLIAPGVAVTGARGWKLVGGSVLSSVTITSFLFVFYSMQPQNGNGGA